MKKCEIWAKIGELPGEYKAEKAPKNDKTVQKLMIPLGKTRVKKVHKTTKVCVN